MNKIKFLISAYQEIKNWYIVPLVYFGLLNREYFILNFRNGLKCKLRTKSTDIHAFANVWLAHEYESVGFKIDEDISIIDVGAHVGLFALYASQICKNGKVFCYEPIKENFDLLQENIKINNLTNIIVYNRLSSEQYCKIYHDVYGIDTISFRITNSFGPREQIIPKKNAVNFLIHQAYKGEKITIFNEGKFFRDLIYISDVISAIKIIMKKGKSGNLYWISSNKKTWFYKLGNMLEKLTNAKIKFVKTPNYTKKVDVGNFIVDNSKLRLLGWKPKISMEEGIKKTIKYFKDEKI